MRTKRIKLYRYNELDSKTKRKVMQHLILDLGHTVQESNEIVVIKEFLQDGTLYNETK